MEKIKNSKLIKYTLIGGGALLLFFSLGVGGYVLYQRQEKEIPAEITQQEEQTKTIEQTEFPAETIIEKNPDGFYTITPSKEDTIQIQDEDGNWVEVPNI